MPVYNTNESYEQIRQEAESKFKQSASAAALIYKGGGTQDFIGVRVECAELSKEFVSNIPFGRGTLRAWSFICARTTCIQRIFILF